MSAFLLRAMITASSTPSPSKSPVSRGVQVLCSGGSFSGLAPPIFDIGGSVTISNPEPNCFSTRADSSETDICAGEAAAGAAGAAVEGACPQARHAGTRQKTSKIRAKPDVRILLLYPPFGGMQPVCTESGNIWEI